MATISRKLKATILAGLMATSIIGVTLVSAAEPYEQASFQQQCHYGNHHNDSHDSMHC